MTTLMSIASHTNTHQRQTASAHSPGSEPLERSAAQLMIDAASRSTKNKMRDQHLHSANFFDVGQHPQSCFSADANPVGRTSLGLVGALAVGGQELALELDAAVLGDRGKLEIAAESEVVQRWLWMTSSPAGTLRAPAKLTVRGRLLPETALPQKRHTQTRAG